MKFIIDNEYPPKHQLTSEEKSFLQKLAGCKLMLDKSLCFQINDLQRHTMLVLSGNISPRKKFPDRADKEREIAELEAIIAEHSSKLECCEIPKEILSEEKLLHSLWEKQLTELKKALDNPAGDKKSHSYLGAYFNRGDNSIVELYVDAIEAKAKNPYDTMLLMGQVLLHEYFHSFYSHVGVGSSKPIYSMEEAMAEYGSLAFLFSVSISRSSIAKQARDAMIYVVDSIEKKRNRVGTSAVYGCGAYLFDYLGEFYREYIARYANVSCLLDEHSKEALEYKYIMYPTYPKPSIERLVILDRFEDLLSQGESVFIQPTSSNTE